MDYPLKVKAEAAEKLIGIILEDKRLLDDADNSRSLQEYDSKNLLFRNFRNKVRDECRRLEFVTGTTCFLELIKLARCK